MHFFAKASAIALISLSFAKAKAQDTPAPASAATPQAEAGPPQRLRISSAVMQGHLIKRVDPSTAPMQAVVVLHVLISSEGKVESAEAMSGPTALRDSAVQAVMKWKYRPFLLNGNPVPVETSVIVDFRH